MNNATIQLTLDPSCMTGFSICIKRLSTIIYISLFLSSLLSLPDTKTLGMTFRYSEKLKTCNWEEKCLKYMNQKMRSDSWVIMQIKKPVKFITPPKSNFHYSFQEQNIETKNEINIP